MTQASPSLQRDLYKCNKCGFCQSACATYQVTGDEVVSGRGLLRLARTAFEGEMPFSHGVAARIYNCLMCRACTSTCPSGTPAEGILMATREALAESDLLPEALAQLARSIQATGNLTGAPAEDRLIWAAGLSVAPPVGGQHETIYFPGCAAASYPDLAGIPRAMVSLLDRAGIDYGLPDGGGDCCGYPLLMMGMTGAAAELARSNVERARDMGARRLLITCASGYRMWREFYPRLLGEELGLEVVHASQWLADADLPLSPVEARVTYHDPCQLGRGSGEYDAPRRFLGRIPGLTVADMANAKGEALCCGAGGSMEWLDPEMARDIAALRMGQAARVEAEMVVTACAHCKRVLSRASNIPVLDVVELAWQAVSQI